MKANGQSLLEHRLVFPLLEIFEHLPGVCFFVKDRSSRFVHANQALLERLGMASCEEILGTTDHDRYPPQVADQLVGGDRKVMESGQPIVDHLEVLFDSAGRLGWFKTTKYAVLDPEGRPLGITGITRHAGMPSHAPGNRAAARAIEYVSENPASPCTVASLARQFGLSERQLHRQFLSAVQLSPREFILRTRIHAAAADLRATDEPIASVSEKYGFCDQSAFTRQFRRILGMPPARYRRSVRVRWREPQ